VRQVARYLDCQVAWLLHDREIARNTAVHYSDGPLGAGQLDGRGVKGVGRHLPRQLMLVVLVLWQDGCLGGGWVDVGQDWGRDGRTVPVRFVLHVTFSEDAVCAELVLRQVGRGRRRVVALIAMKPYSLMLVTDMLAQTARCGRGKLAVVAGILDPVMLIPYVFR